MKCPNCGGQATQLLVSIVCETVGCKLYRPPNKTPAKKFIDMKPVQKYVGVDPAKGQDVMCHIVVGMGASCSKQAFVVCEACTRPICSVHAVQTADQKMVCVSCKT